MTAYAEVIGEPIAHSKSPLIHNFWLAKLGIDAEYRATRVRAEELAEYLAQRRRDPNWRGCNVTMPHKERAAALAEMLDPSAKTVMAANCLCPVQGKLTAWNTDVDGIGDVLAYSDLGGTTVVLGAGGAARAALAVLKRKEAGEVHIVARDPARGQSLLDSFGLRGTSWTFDSRPAIAPPDLLVNATPLGMTGLETLPVGVTHLLDRMDPDQGVVFDMVYAPTDTALLIAAEERGLGRGYGITMLLSQARRAFKLFFGVEAPFDGDGELEALLTA